MDAHEAQARMQEIQRIMERATLFTLLPSTAAILGGLMVLAGCAASVAMFHSLDFGDIVDVSVPTQIVFSVMWFLIGIGGIVLEVVLTTRAARRQNLVPPDRPMRVAALSLTPSVIVAMVLTVKFLLPVNQHLWDSLRTLHLDLPGPEKVEVQYVVPVWMMLYGTGVYTAGLFSIRAPRILGITFIALGIVAMLGFPQYGVVSAALSFGLLHLIFGFYILHHQRQTVS